MTNEKYVTVRLGNKKFKLSVEIDQYQYGGGLAVQLFDVVDHEPWTTVSINVRGLYLPSNEFVFKTYSENEGLLEAMLASGFVEMTGKSADVGPICRLLRHSDGPMKGE